MCIWRTDSDSHHLLMKGAIPQIIVLCTAFSVVLLENDNVAHQCFCKLHGEVDDCSCKVESVDSFNNLKVLPRLTSLLEKDYFRYWKVNLHKDCPFWSDDSRCVLKDCAVGMCDHDKLPDGLKNESQQKHEKDKYSKKANEKNCDGKEDPLGNLDTTISDESRMAFETWKRHDDAQHNFCELDDDLSPECAYVDLLLNPERFTGYKGDSPHRIWNSIYNENCFKPETQEFANYLTTQAGGSSLEEMCLEKRAFYRMISGLHTSINIHLSAIYFFKDALGYDGRWSPNLKEFQKRFAPGTTDGNGPQWLKNLYFTYLVELRALAKAAPYLKKEHYYTGSKEEDQDTQIAVSEILEVAKSFPDHFDESKLFSGDKKEALQLKEEVRLKFRNISRIMDCVGCDKCKLWGKLQVTGLGTAMKILFSGDTHGPDSILTQEHKLMERPFQLRRQEIVALFNAFGRLSKSISEIEMFRKMLS